MPRRSLADMEEEDVVDDLDVDDESGDLPLRKRLNLFLNQTSAGAVLQVCDAALMVTAIAAYIAETRTSGRWRGLVLLEAVLLLWFILWYLLMAFLAQHRLKYVTSLQSLFDLMSIAPAITFGFTGADLAFWVRGVRLLRLSRLSHMFQMVSWGRTEIQVQLLRMAFTVLTLTITFAGIIHLVDNEGRVEVPVADDDTPLLTFYDSFYLIIMSITTVGYGDISPVSNWGRTVVMLMMGAALLTVPRQTNRLILLLSRQSEFADFVYRPSRNTQHIVVGGSLGSFTPTFGQSGPAPNMMVLGNGAGLRPFLEEFFHEDHGSGDRHVVAVAPGTPSLELQSMLEHPVYKLGITYVDGDMLRDKDLARTAVSSAKGLFLLSNKYAVDPDAEDSSTIMRAVAAKRFVYQTTGRDVYTVVQLIRPENAKLFLSSCVPYSIPAIVNRRAASSSSRLRYSPSKSAFSAEGTRALAESTNLSVNINRIKINLLAKSCMCPGLSTMIYNLVSSAATSDEDVSESRALREYKAGVDYEIYRVPVPPGFSSMPFSEFASLVYEQLSVTVFALELCVPNVGAQVYLNPGHTPIVPPHLDPYVYVMAGDKKEADQIAGLGGAPTRKQSRRQLLKSQSSQESASRGGGGLSSAAVAPMESPKSPTHAMRALGTVELDSDGDEAKASRGVTASRIVSSMSAAVAAAAGAGAGGSLHSMSRAAPASPKRSHTPASPKQSYGRPTSATSAEESYASVVVESPILTDVAEASVKIENHIIVAARTMGDAMSATLYHFLQPLRADHLAECPPVVVLVATLPDIGICENLAQMGDIWFVQGSPMEEDDLQRAALYSARSVVIFTSTNGHGTAPGDTLVDADTICIYKLVRTLNLKVEIVCEIVNHAHIPFMHAEGRSDEIFTSPTFSAGHVLLPSILDILLAQSFFNPHIIKVLNHLVVGPTATPAAASAQLPRMEHSHLYYHPIPKKYVGLTYKHVFLDLLATEGQVALGLRRRPRRALNSQSSEALPYVYTSPKPTTELRADDCLYLLSTKPPGTAASRWGKVAAAAGVRPSSRVFRTFSQLRAEARTPRQRHDSPAFPRRTSTSSRGGVPPSPLLGPGASGMINPPTTLDLAMAAIAEKSGNSTMSPSSELSPS